MFLVTIKDGDTPAGICGLIKREEFSDPDIGFAFLKRYRENEYGIESAQAVLQYGLEALGLLRIIAFADPDNVPSVRLLKRLGFAYESDVRMPEDDHDIKLFSIGS
jgi:RimJ/RimL family protein N-acetyltransferase